MSQYRIISIFDVRIYVNRIISIFVKELSISLSFKRGAYLCQHQGHMNKMDSQYLGNYV